MPAKTLLAQVMSKEEGFGRPETVPTIRHNPGDLRHGPHAHHPGNDPNAVATYDNDNIGWEDFERQLQLYAERGLTVKQMVYLFAPPSDHNNSAQYLNYVCTNANVKPDDLVSKALLTLAR